MFGRSGAWISALEDCLADGASAGAFAAAAAQGRATCGGTARRAPPGARAREVVAPWSGAKIAHRKGKRFVDLQADVTDRDIRLAVHEGYRSVEHVKRYTTLGMGTDQGKTSGTLGYALIAENCGGTIAEGGTTSFRPPYVPITLGALAGTAWRAPFPREPAHADARMAPSRRRRDDAVGPLAPSAMLSAAGRESTRRRQCARRARFAMASVSSTCRRSENSSCSDATQQSSSSVSTSIAGASLPVGRSRYGVMLREDGMVFDDGTTSRLGEHHYFMTTTTAQAGPRPTSDRALPPGALARARRSHRECHGAMGGVRSRRAAKPAACSPQLIDGIDAHEHRIPHMGCATGRFGAAVVHGYCGSASRAILPTKSTCPPAVARRLWRALVEAGRRFGITPYGVDAMNALRIEKGHVTGAELNGRTTPDDLGLGRMVKSDRDFIGRRSLVATRSRRSKTMAARRRGADGPKDFASSGGQDRRRTRIGRRRIPASAS